ncbi:MAG TPA: acyl-ACP thioesterase [Sediminispirochaeta sp.]|nr:acyl-ACP thioesterase [Sediminispirochaeta sp.]
MNDTYIYSMEHTILYSETDARQLLSLPAFFALFQEGALLQAEALGFGASYCEREGLMWVLSRVLLEIDSFPGHRDRITLRTWPKPPKGPFANRDFRLEGSDGRVYARATSAWLLLNQETQRPVRPQPLFKDYPLAELGDAIAEQAPKISVDSGDCERRREVTALYSDLDQNMHVNNTRYIRWFLDSFSPEEMTPNGDLRFSVNYLQAAGYGDRVSLCRLDEEGGSVVRGFLEDGTETFAARISVK